MRESALAYLDIPGEAGPWTLAGSRSEDGHVLDGYVMAASGHWYPVIDGVPSFMQGELQRELKGFAERHQLDLRFGPRPHAEGEVQTKREQAKTTQTFSDKWSRFQDYGLAKSHKDFLFKWYERKFGLTSAEELGDFYRRRRRVLECGPGSGFNTQFIAEHCPGEVFALDISDAAFTTFRNTRAHCNCTVVQADLMNAPFADEWFDFVIADGVLHHTPDTRAAVAALYRKVAPGGQFFFYIYKKMGPARQFNDNHIRDVFTKMDPEECYAACEGFTELGRELSRLNAKIVLEKGIPILGIPAGTHDVQRLIYYSFVKCFWNDAFDDETNNMVNFDWYHPYHAWQHSRAEVDDWLTELGAEDWVFHDANPNGLSVLVTKPE